MYYKAVSSIKMVVLSIAQRFSIFSGLKATVRFVRKPDNAKFESSQSLIQFFGHKSNSARLSLALFQFTDAGIV
jgi:hypothetical protein